VDKKSTGIIVTVITALLCGCPGLLSMCFGLVFAVVSRIPGAEIDVFGSSDPQSALSTGIGALCLGIVFVAIPIVVGIITLRKKPEAGTVAPQAPVEPVKPVEPIEYVEPAKPAESIEYVEPKKPDQPDEPIPPAI